MRHEDVFPAFIETLLSGKPMTIEPLPRFKRQSAIEDAILSYRPDFIEAKEILDSVSAALNKRYGDWTIPDVCESFKDLGNVLEEADRLQGPSDA